MDKRGHSEAEKREKRRRRRKMSQIGAYTFLAGLVVAVLVAAACGVGYLVHRSDEGKQGKNPGHEGSAEASATASVPETEDLSPMTPEEKLEELVHTYVQSMTLEDKAAGLFLVTPEALSGEETVLEAGDALREALEQYAVGGIIYFAGNIESEEQLKDLLKRTALYSRYPLLQAVDEEGGAVSRVAGKGLAEKTDSAEKIGQSGDAQAAYQAGLSIGTYLSELGFQVDFAPVADVANVGDSVMNGRTYGRDAESAIPFVLSMLEGLKEKGVTGCLKHFPGIGSTREDTHEGLSVIDRTAEELRAEELTVFAAGIDAGASMVMVSHAAAPSLTGNYTPSSMSRTVVTDILRNELGFEGVIITDGMNMGAISSYYESDAAAVSALQAGCDMILMPYDFEAAYEGVLKALQNGILSEEQINESLYRIYRVKLAGSIE